MPSYSQLLIIGGSGFLGWNLAKLAAKRYDVSFTYCQRPLTIPGTQDAYHLDIQDPEQIRDVLEKAQPEVIIHTAALTNPDDCEKRRPMAHAVNVAGTRSLAECAEEIGAKLVYISTDLVFDGKQGNYSEHALTNPVNYYGETKLAGEKAVQEVMSTYLIARVALMYGEGNGSHGCFTDWLRNGLKNGQEVTLFADQYRTPLFVKDACRALLELTEKGGKQAIFHLGGNERLNRYEFGQKFCQVFGYDAKLLRAVNMDELPALAPRGADCSLNTGKIQKLLSFQLSDALTGLQKMKKER